MYSAANFTQSGTLLSNFGITNYLKTSQVCDGRLIDRSFSINSKATLNFSQDPWHSSNFEVSSEFRMARYFAVNISYTQDNLNLNRETISFGVALGADFRQYDNLPKQNFFTPENPSFFPKLNARTTWREMDNNYSFNLGLELDNLKWNVLDIFEVNTITPSYQYDTETRKGLFTIGIDGTF